MVLAHGSAQTNSSCVQVVGGTAAGVSPYPDDEPSLTFTMEGATNLKTNTVNFLEDCNSSGRDGTTVRLVLAFARSSTERLFSKLIPHAEKRFFPT